MNYKEHCKQCEQVLGKQWGVVHRWLDEYARTSYPSKAHRAIRHHKEGVEEVKKMWGDEAVKAAEMHIRADLECDEIPTEKEISEQFGV